LKIAEVKEKIITPRRGEKKKRARSQALEGKKETLPTSEFHGAIVRGEREREKRGKKKKELCRGRGKKESAHDRRERHTPAHWDSKKGKRKKGVGIFVKRRTRQGGTE